MQLKIVKGNVDRDLGLGRKLGLGLKVMVWLILRVISVIGFRSYG